MVRTRRSNVGLLPVLGRGIRFRDFRDAILSSLRLRRTRNYKTRMLILKPKIAPRLRCTPTRSSAPSNVRFWGQSGHRRGDLQCLLLTQSGHERVRIAAMQTDPETPFRGSQPCAVAPPVL